MSRLIDADKVLQEKWEVETKDMFHMTEMVEVVSAIDIKNAPTVEAIPVEWVNKYIDSTLDEGNSQMLGFKAAIIKEMIEEWEKENETN